MLDLLRIYVDEQCEIHLVAHWTLVAAVIALAIGAVIAQWWRGRSLGATFEVEEVELGIGNQKLRLKANRDDIRVAYKIWIELVTRKIGIPIDEQDDIIADVYSSWYEFFKICRQLLKEIPAEKLRTSPDTRVLVGLAVRLLNKGLRPHLTKWHGKYRQWIKAAEGKENDGTVTPQDVQRKYPEYQALVDDMRIVNRRLIYFTGVLEKLVYGLDGVK